jgi:hypothetical protein
LTPGPAFKSLEAPVAVSIDARLLGLEEGRVRFRWRDSRDGNQIKEMSLDGVEFIRRFLLHVLPGGFVKIRHFGFLSNRNRKAMVQHCRNLLPPSPIVLAVVRAAEHLCPICKIGHLHFVSSPSASPLASPGTADAATGFLVVDDDDC